MATSGHGVLEATWGPDLFVDEFAELARATGRPVSWAALMTNRRDPGYAPRVAAEVEAAGGDVHPQISCRPIVVQLNLADPFAFANVPAFGEILTLEHPERAARYAAEEWRRRASRDMDAAWGDILDHAVVAESDVHPELVDGATLGELAAARGVEAIDVMVELSLAEDLRTRFTVAMINDAEDQIGPLLRNDRFLLGLSDAGAHTSQLCDANYATHLLGHWCRERGDLVLEKAVWRLTGQPAEVYGIPRPGGAGAGAASPTWSCSTRTSVGTTRARRVRDLPGGADRLVADSIGIDHVLVAGEAVRRDGEQLTGRAAGRLIRGGTR